jgi:hypothetical protein
MPIAIQKECDRMQAIRQIQTVTENFVIVQLPESFRQRRIEVIVLPVDDPEEMQSAVRRVPPTHLLGKGRITGDIISPIVPESDWECLS